MLLTTKRQATREGIMVVQIAQKQTARGPTARKQFTVAEYARMHEVGIFAEDERVELLDGEVCEMSPVGSIHAAIVKRLNVLLSRSVGDTAIVSVQDPIRLDDWSEPQPDIALLTYRDDFYANALPGADDVLLVIEVSDTSLAYDRDEKLPRYAAAGIPEVWIVDVAHDRVEQYTQPRGNNYRMKLLVERGESVVVQHVAGVQIEVEQVFG
jgi:Uma2 family endonuclease